MLSKKLRILYSNIFIITCSKNSLLQFWSINLYKEFWFCKILSKFSNIFSGEISIDIMNLNNWLFVYINSFLLITISNNFILNDSLVTFINSFLKTVDIISLKDSSFPIKVSKVLYKFPKLSVNLFSFSLSSFKRSVSTENKLIIFEIFSGVTILFGIRKSVIFNNSCKEKASFEYKSRFASSFKANCKISLLTFIKALNSSNFLIKLI